MESDVSGTDMPLLRCDEPAALRAIDRLRDAHPRTTIADELERAVRTGRISEDAFKRHSRWCNTRGSYSAGVDPARDAALAMYGFVPDRLQGEDGVSEAAMLELLR